MKAVDLGREESKHEPKVMEIDTSNTLWNEFSKGAQVSDSVEIIDE